MHRRSAAKVLVATVTLSLSIIVLTGVAFLTDGPEPKRKLYTKTVIFPQAGSDTVFNQPWSIPEPKTAASFANERLIYSNFSYSKGMGNQMFQLASLTAIAARHKAKVVIPVSLLLRRSFTLDDPHLLFAEDSYIDRKLQELKDRTIDIQSCCSYQDVQLDFSRSQEAVVLGYLQSRAYLDSRGKETKEMFTFHKDVQQMASDFLQSAFIERSLRIGEARMRAGAIIGVDEDIDMAGDPLDSNVFIVGVHVRRGMDIRLNERNRRHGHVAAPLEYFKKAMKLAVEDRDDYLYLICSDDIAWAKKTFKEEEYGSVAFCPSRWREVDMALLLRSDVLVLSTGTFSWWAGYLSQNPEKVYYYGGWPKAGSLLDHMVDKKNYFPSKWIPLS